ncbi:MAG: DUF4363 family protein [Oscillospiraceae bacterium]|nr:DUF4363 family protein [Oscillospiraceae bacterium]
MKMKLLSAGVILLLILTGFGNSIYVTARCEGWERQLTAAEAAAVEEDWETATIQLDALHRSWDKAEDYLHIVLHHEEVEDALVLMQQCRLFAALQDGDALLAAGEQLRCQYRHLAETEELHLKNIL